jgi:hypothetical protein
MFYIVTYKHFWYLRNTLFRNGKFDKSIRLLHMHAANERNGFASPAITNDTAFEQFVLESFPGLGNTLQPSHTHRSSMVPKPWPTRASTSVPRLS